MRCSPGGSSRFYGSTGRSSGSSVIAAAAARRAKILKQIKSDANRLKAADQLFNQGDVDTASMLWTRLAMSRLKSPLTVIAKERLVGLADHGRGKLEEMVSRLPGATKIASTSEVLLAAGGDQASLEWRRSVVLAFEELDAFARQYADVPGFGNQAKRRVGELRRNLKYATVLDEAEAKKLLDLADSYVAEDQQCCALLVYERAARLAPSASSVIARDRLAAMNKNPSAVAQAKACRELKWCHEAYVRAERLIKVKPDRAKELFGDVVNRAPPGSEVHREARARIHELTPSKT